MAMAGRFERAEAAFLHGLASRRCREPSNLSPRDLLARATGGGLFRQAGGSSGGTPSTESASIHSHQSSANESVPFLPHSGSSTTPPAQQQRLEADPRPSDTQGEHPPAADFLPHSQYSRGGRGNGNIRSMGVELESNAGGRGAREDVEVPQRRLLVQAWKMLKYLVCYLICGPSADHQQEPDATLMYPYDGYDIEAAQHMMQNRAVPPAAELRRRNTTPFSVNSAVAQAQEKRQAVNDWMKQVGDAIAVPQALTRLAYFAEITLWTSLLLHRVPCPTTLAPTREVVAMAIEMFVGFLVISYTHYCIVSHHSVSTTALHISERTKREMAIMFVLITCGWMICYTLNISPSVYHNWMWAITVPFVGVNINNTRVYGCKGLMTEARVLHI